MNKPPPFILFRKTFWLTILKLAALAFVTMMLAVHVPEITYDLGPKTPRMIESPEELARSGIKGPTFVSLAGTPDFEKGFVYKRYGLSYTYFNIKPYGLTVVVRTHDRVTDEWNGLDRFLGRLRAFESQPFSYRIRDIYLERFQAEIPEGAYFLALDDVPSLSGWQTGALVFGILLWLVLFWFFFIFPRRKR